ncbi:MAG: class I SAM-dependent RNA methyltransferase [Alphaproteobacteria bacterium]|nr:class I SAM-dependent RNA methyltransferase [Alphaproteobacteria bacterium]
MKKCPFFGVCGGCKYDFTDAGYRTEKLAEIARLKTTDDAKWVDGGLRRRGDFCFAGGKFGFFKSGSKDIVAVRDCLNMVPEINKILPRLAELPWIGAGSCLVTLCENGIDIAINADVPYFTPEFKTAAEKIGAQRIVWNNRVVAQSGTPVIKFGDVAVEYPSNAFLQPSKAGEDMLRQMVVSAAGNSKHVADLFCGLGNFTFATHADGFDIVGTGVKRDLFEHPLTVGMLNKYDCVILDPPRAGASAQCTELVKSNVKRIVYVSCNPSTFRRDMSVLNRGGYKLIKLVPVDQFVGSSHWELFSVFEK